MATLIMEKKPMIIFFRFFSVIVLSFIWIAPLQALSPQKLTPVMEGVDLYILEDETYFFPANHSPSDKTVFLPLQRWDLIFTGGRINVSTETMDSENINHLIPGPFNHLMVYMGKDGRGLAYAIELNLLSLEQNGVLSLICLGSDFGILRHPDTGYIQDRSRTTHRWARRLIDSAHEQLLANEQQLLAKLHEDLIMGFPYQLEFEYSGNLFDTNIYLVDDGFEGGAGCSDYWTTLFETYGNLCIKNVRMGANELVDYFQNDPQGRLAYVPPEISPFPGKIFIWEVLDLGFKAIIDAPHLYACDNSEEIGIVLPSLIMESDLLQEITPLNLPIPGSWVSPFFR